MACEDQRLSQRRSSDVLSVCFERKGRVGRSKLIQTNLTEPDIELGFHELNSLSLVRLMKSSTYGPGLSLNT